MRQIQNQIVLSFDCLRKHLYENNYISRHNQYKIFTFIQKYKMKLRLNLTYIQAALGDVFHRFPFVMIMAAISTFFLLSQIGEQDYLKGFNTFNGAVASYTAALVLLNLQVIREVFSFSKISYYSGLAIILLLTIFYYFLLPDSESEASCMWTFAIGLCIVLHLTLSFIPYIRKYDSNYMLHYNFSLLFGWLKAFLYGMIIYLSLGLAILALDKLFNVTMGSYVYIRLFILVAGIFHSAYFLFSFPENYTNISELNSKSIFSILIRFAFVPIVILYAVILFAYIIKLFITTQALEDWVSELILWFFVTGIFTWLCTRYTYMNSESGFLKSFQRLFFPLSLPLIILLLYALMKSMNTFGIREDSYLKALLASWLILTTLIFLVMRRKEIIWLPVTLILITITGLMSGPLSVCSVPVKSQQKKLISLFEEINVIQNGKLQDSDSITHHDSSGVINDIVYYLHRKDALGFLDAYDKDSVLTQANKNFDPGMLMTVLGVSSYFYTPEMNDDFVFNMPAKQIIDIEEFSNIIPLVASYESTDLQLYARVTASGIEIVEDNRTVSTFDIRTLLNELSQSVSNPKNDIVLRDGNIFVKLYISYCYAVGNGPNMKINEIQGIVLFKKQSE